MEQVRIHKWLSQQGRASRREAERWIQEGRVRVNGQVIDLGTKIDPDIDHVEVDRKSVGRQTPPRVYWLLHKPAGYLTSRKSQDDRPTIFDLPRLAKLPFLLSSIGRLDYNTEGLLLLSNDGELVFRLSHPKYKVDRRYAVLADGRLTAQQEADLRRGIVLGDGPVAGIEIQYLHGQKLKGGKRGSWYFVTVKEGRNRLVRRLFEHFDLTVQRLVRQSYGALHLPDNLPPGEYRQLNAKQIKSLKQAVSLQ